MWVWVRFKNMKNENAVERLLTIQEAADMMRLSPNTLAWFRKQNRPPKFGKLGRRVFYRESDVKAFIDAQFEGGAA